jgi:hypothetical protein
VTNNYWCAECEYGCDIDYIWQAHIEWHARIRTFYLWRDVDVSGVSGTGKVAQGVSFPNGTTVLQWANYGSLSIFKNVREVIQIHGHDGKTKLTWSN